MTTAAVASEILTRYDILVSSAAGATGAVRDGVFRFEAATGRFLGRFGHGVEISDPRGIRLSPDGAYVVVNNGDNMILTLDAKTGSFIRAWPVVEGLDPGGGKFGWDGRYYVGSRAENSVIAFDPSGQHTPSTFVPGGYVAFPRGLATSRAGQLYLASGTNPVTGEGLNTILRFDQAGRLDESFKVVDEGLSPLDLAIGPNDTLLSASEFPFADAGAVTTVREYDARVGHLLRVFDAGADRRGRRITRKPRGIAVGPDGGLYASGADNVVRYELATGCFDRVLLESADVLIQSIIFIPR